MIDRAKAHPSAFLKLPAGIFQVTLILLLIVVIVAMIVSSKFWHSHGISLDGSKEQIRTLILTITPLVILG